MDTSNYTYFVLTEKFRNRAATVFSGYQDKNGDVIEIFMGRKDNKGDFIPEFFKFAKDKRYFYKRNNLKDINGRSVVEFLRNHPLCEGSELQKELGTLPLYKEMNTAKDAAVAVEYKKEKLKAEQKAMDLNQSELKAAAVLCGCFSHNETEQLHKVLEYAGAEPKAFLKTVESDDFTVRALIRSLIAKGILERVGTIIKWDNVTIGTDENGAVAKLVSDEELLNTLKGKEKGE